MTDRLDLPSRYRDQIEALLREHVPGVAVWAYGSRVNGESHDASDLDLVLRGPDLKRISSGQLADLTEALEESNVPIIVQVHDWARLPESFHREIEQAYVVLVENEEQSIASERVHCTLADACSAINYGLTASASDDSAGLKFLRITDIVSGQLDWNTVPHVVVDNHDIMKYQLYDGDIVIARTGASTGVSLYIKNPPPAVFASYLVRLQAKPDFDARFLAYYLKSREFKEFISGVLGDKSAQPNASASTMTAAPLSVPKYKAEQCAIAHILGTLDDKIELNRRMNETLEEMARALFKSWFVDFDPVRTKMKGRDPCLPARQAGLPKHLADLFPNRLVDSELGPIPEGWEAGVLDDAVELLSGGTPRTSVASYWNGDIPWYTAKDAPSLSDVFVLDTERAITQAGVENSSTKILPFGTTIITARGTVGRLACLGMPMAMNQTCYGIRGTRGYGDFFTYWTIRRAVDDLQNRTHGTIFDTITRQTFKIVDMVLPPVNVAEAFERTVNPFMGRILNHLHASRTLAAQRDALLPKLVSGDLRVDGRAM